MGTNSPVSDSGSDEFTTTKKNDNEENTNVDTSLTFSPNTTMTSGGGVHRDGVVNQNSTMESLSGLNIVESKNDDGEIEILFGGYVSRNEGGEDGEEAEAIGVSGHQMGLDDLLSMSLEQVVKSFDMDSSDDDRDVDNAAVVGAAAPSLEELIAAADAAADDSQNGSSSSDEDDYALSPRTKVSSSSSASKAKSCDIDSSDGDSVVIAASPSLGELITAAAANDSNNSSGEDECASSPRIRVSSSSSSSDSSENNRLGAAVPKVAASVDAESNQTDLPAGTASESQNKRDDTIIPPNAGCIIDREGIATAGNVNKDESTEAVVPNSSDENDTAETTSEANLLSLSGEILRGGSDKILRSDDTSGDSNVDDRGTVPIHPAPTESSPNDTPSQTKNESPLEIVTPVQNNEILPVETADFMNLQRISDSSLTSVSLNDSDTPNKDDPTCPAGNSLSSKKSSVSLQDGAFHFPPPGKKAGTNWRNSFHRLKSATASVASTVAHAAGPVLADAHNVATYIFGQDMRTLKSVRNESQPPSSEAFNHFTHATASTASTILRTAAPVLSDARDTAMDVVATFRRVDEEWAGLNTEEDTTVAIRLQKSSRQDEYRLPSDEQQDSNTHVAAALDRLTSATMSAANSIFQASGPILTDVRSVAVHFAEIANPPEDTIMKASVPVEHKKRLHASSPGDNADVSTSSSLSRLTAAATSAASSMANVAGPVLADAGNTTLNLLETCRREEIGNEQEKDETSDIPKQHSPMDTAKPNEAEPLNPEMDSGEASDQHSSNQSPKNILSTEDTTRSADRNKQQSTNLKGLEVIPVAEETAEETHRSSERKRSTEHPIRNMISLDMPQAKSVESEGCQEPNDKQSRASVITTNNSSKSSGTSWMRFSAATESVARSAARAATPLLGEAKIVVADFYRSEVEERATKDASTEDTSAITMPLDGSRLAVENSEQPGREAASCNSSCGDLVGVILSPPGVVRHSKADIFRQRPQTPKGIKARPLNARPKNRLEIGSLSSASGTMSPGSTSRGILSPRGILSSGMASPLGGTLSHTNSRNDVAKPPLFPKRKDIHDSPNRFVEFLSKRLAEQGAVEDQGGKEQGSSKWLREVHPTDSVFAEGADSSPPGSSPVPDHSSDVDDGEMVWEDGAEGCVQNWELAPDRKTQAAASLPLNVVVSEPTDTPQDDMMEWGMSSHASFSSADLGNSGRHSDSGQRGSDVSFASQASDVNTLRSKNIGRGRSDLSASSRKLRVQGRKLSVSGRGLGRYSPSGRRITKLDQGEDSRNVQSEGLSSILVEEEDSMSTGAHSFTPSNVNLNSTPHLQRRTMSFPDMRLIKSSPTNVNKNPDTQSKEYNFADSIDNDSILLDGVNMINGNGLKTLPLPMQDEALLEEALMKFLSVNHSSFPFSPDPCKYTSDDKISLQWRQLLSVWKHSEVTKALNLRHPSDHFASGIEDNSVQELSEESPASVFPVGRGEIENLELNGISFCDYFAQRAMKNLDGFTPHLEEDNIPPLSSFLTILGRQRLGVIDGPCVPLRHSLPSSPSLIDSKSLLDVANANLESFTKLIEDVTRFSFDNDQDPMDNDTVRTWYSVGVKDAKAIERKASRKYHGDILKVKDTLRGRIVFPNESSMVCGLIQLLYREKNQLEDGPQITIVRAKNLFRSDGAVDAIKTTGYRHVLVNIRLDNGLLAEIQFNLSCLFDVLGEDGYCLHREICDAGLCGNATDLMTRVISIPENDKFTANSDGSPSTTSVSNSVKASDSGEGEKCNSNPSKDEPTTTKDMSSCNDQGQCDVQMNDYSVLLALLEHGAHQLATNPRDVPSFYCMCGLLVCTMEDKCPPSTAHESLTSRDQLVNYATTCLLRCLTISYQTTAGILGWLECSSSYPDRVAERPFASLHHLATLFASQCKWKEAEGVLQAAMLRLEQHLPLYHPLTIVSILFFAGCASMTSRTEFASNLVDLAHRRLAVYLSEMESLCFNRLEEVVSASFGANSSFFIGRGRDPFLKLKTFIAMMQKQSKRTFLSTFGAQHDITLIHHSLLADAVAVLANCIKTAESLETHSPDYSQSAEYWSLAYAHYKIAFEGFSQTRGYDDATTYTTALGLARCLRELQLTDQAVRVLSAVVKNAEESLEGAVGGISGKELGQDSSSKTGTDAGSMHYILGKRPDRVLSLKGNALITRDTSLGMCFWLLAVLSVDGNPTGLGRCQAIRYLQASSKSLQLAMKMKKITVNQAGTMELLSIVETEARRLMG